MFTRPGLKKHIINIANLRYPAKNDKFFAGERRNSLPVVPHKAVAEVSKIGNL